MTIPSPSDLVAKARALLAAAGLLGPVSAYAYTVVVGGADRGTGLRFAGEAEPRATNLTPEEAALFAAAPRLLHDFADALEESERGLEDARRSRDATMDVLDAIEDAAQDDERDDVRRHPAVVAVRALRAERDHLRRTMLCERGDPGGAPPGWHRLTDGRWARVDGFMRVWRDYESGWHRWLFGLRGPSPSVPTFGGVTAYAAMLAADAAAKEK